MLLIDYLPSYRAALKGAGRRPRGIDKYDHTMQRFIAWLGYTATQADITTPSVQSYQEELAEHCSASTISNALSTIRSFCKWSIRKQFRSDDPTIQLDWPKKEHHLPRPLSTAELQTLLTAITPRPHIEGGELWMLHRNRRAIFLMLYGGLRLSEAAALQWKDVHLEQETLIVRQGKGGKDRGVPLHPSLLGELLSVPAEDRQPEHAVAGQQNGQSLTYKSMGRIFERWLRKRSVHVSAHRLRHTFATELLRNGANIRHIQALLGHAGLETTEKYLGIAVHDLRSAIHCLPKW